MNTLFSISSPLLTTLVAGGGKLTNVPTIKLIGDLSSTDSRTRCNAARELGNRGRVGLLGKHGNAAIKALINALTHKDLNTAQAADEALVKIGEPAVRFLKDVLCDGTETMRERAITCLGNMRDKASGALSEIRDIANQNDEKMGVRFAAVWAIGNIVSKLNDYPEINSVVAELTDMLKPDNSHICYCAAEALGKIGTRAKGAVPYLKPLLKDGNATVRNYAKWAIAQIAPDGAKNLTKPAEKTHKEIWFELNKKINDAKKEYEQILKTDK